MQGQGAYILMLATIFAGMAACGGTGGRLEPFAPGSVKVGGEIGRNVQPQTRTLSLTRYCADVHDRTYFDLVR